jgi:hypothetical protein
LVSYSDNSGGSIEDAIIILDAANSMDGVRAEYDYLTQQYGQQGTDWRVEGQRLLFENGVPYDVIYVVFPDGEKAAVYFDISGFFGKF